MPKKHTIGSLSAKMKDLPGALTRRFKDVFTKAANIALVASQKYVPENTGALRRSAVAMRAVVGPEGITSKFIYKAPYAATLESGEKNGKKLNISKRVNPNAQAKFVEKGLDKVDELILQDVSDAIETAFERL